MRTWIKTVTYSIEADTLEEAQEAWDESGPEVSDDRRVSEVAFSDLELEDPEVTA